MTLEETVLAIRLHKLAVALGVFIVSAPAFSHGHHSHGKPLTEVEQKAANGVFDDAWICPYISRHLLSLNPLLACCRRYSRGER